MIPGLETEIGKKWSLRRLRKHLHCSHATLIREMNRSGIELVDGILTRAVTSGDAGYVTGHVAGHQSGHGAATPVTSGDAGYVAGYDMMTAFPGLKGQDLSKVFKALESIKTFNLNDLHLGILIGMLIADRKFMHESGHEAATPVTLPVTSGDAGYVAGHRGGHEAKLPLELETYNKNNDGSVTTGHQGGHGLGAYINDSEEREREIDSSLSPPTPSTVTGPEPVHGTQLWDNWIRKIKSKWPSGGNWIWNEKSESMLQAQLQMRVPPDQIQERFDAMLIFLEGHAERGNFEPEKLHFLGNPIGFLIGEKWKQYAGSAPPTENRTGKCEHCGGSGIINRKLCGACNKETTQ